GAGGHAAGLAALGRQHPQGRLRLVLGLRVGIGAPRAEEHGPVREETSAALTFSGAGEPTGSTSALGSGGGVDLPQGIAEALTVGGRAAHGRDQTGPVRGEMQTVDSAELYVFRQFVPGTDQDAFSCDSVWTDTAQGVPAVRGRFGGCLRSAGRAAPRP